MENKIKTTVDDNPNQTNLLSISDLSGELICNHLNRSSLLSFRLVCQKSKSWVESPNILKRIPIELNNSKQLQRVMQSTVPWNNFSILCCGLETQTYLPRMIRAYGHRIKVLKITTLGGYRQKTDFLLDCPCLEVLEIGDLNLGNVTSTEFDQLLRHFENLKELTINEIKAATQESAEMVMRFLTRSLKLRCLKLPIFRWDDSITPAEKDDADHKAFQKLWMVTIIHPLIKYLELRQTLRPPRRNLEFLDIERLTGNSSDFDQSSFTNLALACQNSKTRLRNVSRFLLTRFQIPQSCLQSIHSFDGFQYSVDFDGMTNLKELKVSITPLDADAASGAHPLFNYHFPLSNLETLDVTLMFNIDQHPLPEMINGLFKTDRPSVKNLKIKWDLAAPKMVIDVHDLVRRFPNVRTLELDGCPGTDKEFITFFQGMKKLEELKIKDCRYITDYAFLRGFNPNDPSPFLQLKSLKRVWIRAYKSFEVGTGITDQTFRNAFARMPIRHLTFNTIGPTNITTNGLAALIREPFRNTIEYLDVMRPVGVPDHRLYGITRAFKNLKRGFKSKH